MIKLNRPSKGNAMGSHTYELLSQRLREAERADVLAVIVTGEGRFFSAGADVTQPYVADGSDLNTHVSYVKRFASGSLDLVNLLANYSKVLIAGINGPAVGFSAGLLGHFDFCYATEDAYIYTPFTSLGLTAEGGSSVTFVQRMGITKAKEALYLGKRIPATELKQCGFLNDIFPRDGFQQRLVKMIEGQFAPLDRTAVLRMKKMLREHGPDVTATNYKEILGVIDAFESGRPQEKFKALAAKL